MSSTGTGFGETTRFTGPTAIDWGFGDPTPTGWNPALGYLTVGFGDPSVAPSVPLPLPGDTRYSDEGGEIVNLEGVWPQRGPYRVRLDGPSGLSDFCYSARPGKGIDCETEPQQKILSFSTLPLPVGTYAIVIYYGAAFGSQVRLENALEIVTRGQAEEVYQTRGRFPSWWKTGPRRAAIDPLDLPAHPTPPLYSVLRSLGQLIQQLIGSPSTRLTGILSHGDASAQVESVLGFPEDGGRVWIRGRLYTYTDTIGGTLNGLELVSATDGLPLNPREQVILDARALLPD